MEYHGLFAEWWQNTLFNTLMVYVNSVKIGQIMTQIQAGKTTGKTAFALAFYIVAALSFVLNQVMMIVSVYGK